MARKNGFVSFPIFILAVAMLLLLTIRLNKSLTRPLPVEKTISEVETFYEKGYLDKNGNLVVQDLNRDELTSDFISVLPGEKLYFEMTFSKPLKAWARVTEYDENKSRVSGSVYNTIKGDNLFDSGVSTERTYNSYVVSGNTKYIKISYASWSSVDSGQQLQIVKKGVVGASSHGTRLNRVPDNANTVENDLVSMYMQTACPDDDYSFTDVLFFAENGYDIPKPVEISWDPEKADHFRVVFSADGTYLDSLTFVINGTSDSISISNVIPDGSSSYIVYKNLDGEETEIESRKCGIDGLGVRMIHAEGIHNVRDLGGWKSCDGGYIKYGLIYRGSALDENDHSLTESGRLVLHDQLRIRKEIDLRGSRKQESDVSVIGDDCRYVCIKSKSNIRLSWKSRV